MYIIKKKKSFCSVLLMLESFFHQKIMRPLNLLEQIRNFQHSATLLPKFSLIFLQITSFKAIIEKTKYKISAQNNVLQNVIDSKLGHLKQHFKMLISCWNQEFWHHYTCLRKDSICREAAHSIE